jgi:hypothetical protein
MVNCEARIPMKEKKKVGCLCHNTWENVHKVGTNFASANWVLETDTFSEEGTKKKSLGNNILF